jgi:SAM-dependent methyltransferase
MNVPHSPEFFEQMRSCRNAYRRLADCIDAALASLPSVVAPRGGEPVTLLDIGCGTGAQTARLAELGWTAVGVDVFDVHPEPGFAFRNVDLLEVGAKLVYDVVLCTETAEHIEESRADKLVDAVARRARSAIVWSAAVPGQEWEGHVNLKPREWWLNIFKAYGWIPNMTVTNELRRSIVETGAQQYMEPGVSNFFILIQGSSSPTRDETRAPPTRHV